MTPERAATLQYGVYIIPGLAGAWPELRAMVQKIFLDRVSKIPWLPSSWLTGVVALQQSRPNDLVTLAPSRRANVGPTGVFVDANGPPSADLPLFLDDDEKINAWQAMWYDMDKARGNYAAAQAAAGRAQLDALYAKAAFWDATYKIAVFTANLPANIVSSVGGGVVSFVGTFLPERFKAYAKWVTIAIVLLIVGSIVLWYRNRLAGLFKGLKGAKAAAKAAA